MVIATPEGTVEIQQPEKKKVIIVPKSRDIREDIGVLDQDLNRFIDDERKAVTTHPLTPWERIIYTHVLENAERNMEMELCRLV